MGTKKKEVRKKKKMMQMYLMNNLTCNFISTSKILEMKI